MDPVCHISRLRGGEVVVGADAVGGVRFGVAPLFWPMSGCEGSRAAPGWWQLASLSIGVYDLISARVTGARGKRKSITDSSLNPGENAPGGYTMAACVPPISGAVSAHRACAGQRKRTSCQLVLFSPRATLRRAPASVKLVEATCAMGTTRVTVGPQGVHPRLGGGVQCSTNLLSLTTACGVR